MENEVNEFCRKYDAYVGPSNRMHRRARRVPFSVWEQDPNIFQTIPYEEVKCVEVHIPEERFRALLEHDEWISQVGLHNNNHFNNNVGRVSQMIVDHERECRIRHENPAIRAAYEKYQTLLRLVDSYYD